MGGPVSPLLWCLGYDPLIEGTRAATGADTPTYADDLMGEVVGPHQALAMQLFLLAVSKAVGLRIDTHSCLGAQVDAPLRAVQRSLAALPVHICGHDRAVA
eukprot:2138016-Alexandrium_andersonii.AAC.1